MQRVVFVDLGGLQSQEAQGPSTHPQILPTLGNCFLKPKP